MNISPQGLDLLSQREGGFVLHPYRDTRGIWTDGLGNTHGVVPNGPPITMEKARADFARNSKWVAGALASVRVPLEQHQYDALFSFAFNVGGSAFLSSTLLKLINAGDMQGAAAQFDRWHIPPEITSRRNGEREQFKGTHVAARIEGEAA